MNLDKANQWLTLLANIGVVIGIVFLAFEIRTNTSTNRTPPDVWFGSCGSRPA